MKNQWPRLSGSEIKASLAEISTELDNVRVAWEWGVSQHKAAEIEAALHSLWFYYGVGVRYREGAQLLSSAVSAFSDTSALYGKLIAHCGELIFLLGSLEKARKLLLESLRVLRQAEARYEIAFVLYRLALFSLCDFIGLSEAVTYLEESLALYTELDDHFGMGEALFMWGDYHLHEYSEHSHEGALEQARQCYEESLAAFQKRGSIFGIASVRLGLSQVAMLQEQYAAAYDYTQTSRTIFKDLSIGWGIRNSLVYATYTAYKLCNYAEARQAALENLRFNSQYQFVRDEYDSHPMLLWLLASVHLTAAILVSEGEQEQAYELLGFVGQQSPSWLERSGAFGVFLLHLLDEDLPPHLKAAVERGRKRELEMVVKEVIADLSAAVENATPLPVTAALTGLADPLTEREIEILRLVADGLNSRDVAERLHLSVTTVRWYLRQIYSKLDVHSRGELIARARALELLV